jgi:hypothetical protein
MNPRNFFAELKRRNVYKVAIAYAVVGWLLIQAASILFRTFDAPKPLPKSALSAKIRSVAPISQIWQKSARLEKLNPPSPTNLTAQSQAPIIGQTGRAGREFGLVGLLL